MFAFNLDTKQAEKGSVSIKIVLFALLVDGFLLGSVERIFDLLPFGMHRSFKWTEWSIGTGKYSDFLERERRSE